MANRLRAEGFQDVHTQVRLCLSLRDFKKSYFLDLVVNGIVYELKASEELIAAHDAQVYHYAAILGLDRIKLLGFGAASVQGRLRRTPFAAIDRLKVTVDRARWRALTKSCDVLAADAEACFREWGGFLDGRVFQEALIWFNGGLTCIRRLPVTRDGTEVGTHRVLQHAAAIAFHISCLDCDLFSYERHLSCLLNALPLRAWQWINIHHSKMTFVTLVK